MTLSHPKGDPGFDGVVTWHSPLRILLVSVLSAGTVACTEVVSRGQQTGSSAGAQITKRVDRLEPVEVSLTGSTFHSTPYQDFIIVPESHFLAAVENAGSVVPEARAYAAEFAASANDPNAAGVWGPFEYDTWFEGTLFIVAREAGLSPGGTHVEVRDFYVAAVEARGMASWVGTSANLAVLNTTPFPPDDCTLPSRGCAPLNAGPLSEQSTQLLHSADNGSAGLPKRIVINPEAPPVASNASGKAISLRLYSDSSYGREPNRFLCRGPLSIEECTDLPEANSPLGTAVEHYDLSQAIVISEADFFLNLQAGNAELSNLETRQLAFEAATIGNHDDALGVIAELEAGPETPFEGDLFIVTRNAVEVSADTPQVHASQYFVVPVAMSGTAAWLGTGTSIGFGKPLPGLDFNLAPCDTVFIPREDPGCFAGVCPPPGITPNFESSILGSDRWNMDLPRVSIGLPDFSRPQLDITKFVCSLFQVPPPIPPLPANCGLQGEEACNGQDDDCDEEIDDEGACENRNTSCSCQPMTCSSQGVFCGTAPSGCGQSLTCGPTCP